MIEILNRLVDEIEQRLGEDLDVDELAAAMGTTGYHARRMFSSLAGMPVSDYVRRRRMTVAAADVVGDEDLLTIAVRYGYGSTEAFGRAFRAVHGASQGGVRRDGGPLRNQPQLRFVIDVDAGEWVVFRTSGPHPAALQEAYAASAAEWFPSNPWRLRPGPSIVSVLDRAADFSTATCELWFPIERA
jgi:AraC-like DNA-binding protein